MTRSGLIGWNGRPILGPLANTPMVAIFSRTSRSIRRATVVRGTHRARAISVVGLRPSSWSWPMMRKSSSSSSGALVPRSVIALSRLVSGRNAPNPSYAHPECQRPAHILSRMPIFVADNQDRVPKIVYFRLPGGRTAALVLSLRIGEESPDSIEQGARRKPGAVLFYRRAAWIGPQRRSLRHQMQGEPREPPPAAASSMAVAAARRGQGRGDQSMSH